MCEFVVNFIRTLSIAFFHLSNDKLALFNATFIQKYMSNNAKISNVSSINFTFLWILWKEAVVHKLTFVQFVRFESGCSSIC